MAKKSDEIYAILKVIDKNKLDKPSLIKNRSRYKEVKQAILVIADIIWDCDENAKINIVEEMGTAISSGSVSRSGRRLVFRFSLRQEESEYALFSTVYL